MSPVSMKYYYPDFIFENLKDSPNLFGDSVEVNIFVDTSHAGDKLYRKPVTDILIYFGDTLIEYISRSQESVAISTFLSEYISLKFAVEDAQGMRLLLRSTGVPSKSPIKLYRDS